MTIATLYIAALAIILGALGRRFAGGLISQWLGMDITTQPARIIWAIVNAGLVYWAGMSLLPSLLIIPAIWAGAAGFGYWGSMSAGNQPGRNTVTDFALLTAHGIGSILFILPIFLYWAPGYNCLWLLLPVIVCPISYRFAWNHPLQLPVLGCLTVDPPPTAELIWGASFGLALVLAV